ncbi:cell cycle checkpoint control protein RAD9A isoform X2 [Mobula hypostoma]|uniref:cell cycle checkpoint control protein RAD9A isoform X2 n=1 Tax=Mobula hypostoma TaxID=723540 RepID=UPI002FC3250C
MRCVVTGGNVTVLARAIHALARVGDECYLEAFPEGLALRTVNPSRSAYASFLLGPLFFQKYEEGSCRGARKLVMKSMLSVFKSSTSAERAVELCKLVLDKSGDRLLVQFLCRHGITRTHNLCLMDCETLQAIYSEQDCENSLCAQPRLLTETAVHFPVNQEEVTLEVDVRRAILRNYTEPSSDLRKTVLTELALTAQEFDHFSVNDPSEITFCLKELRGLLNFAEPSGLPISIHFSGPGSPAIFSVRESVLEVTWLLATLADHRTTSQRARRKDTNSSYAEISDANIDFPEEMEVSLEGRERFSPESRQTEPPGHSPGSPLAPASKRSLVGEAEGEEEDEADVEEIPATPPQKKFRSLFFGSTLSPERCSPPGHEVLATDSDTDADC